MLRELQLNLQLTPVYNYDNKTDQYTTYFEEFPNAIAVGENEQEAELRLAHLVEKMWVEEADDVRNFFLERYSDKIKAGSKIKIA